MYRFIKDKWQYLTVAGLGGLMALSLNLGTVSTTFAQAQTPTPGATPSVVQPGLPKLGGRDHFGGHGLSLATIAKALNMSETDLQTALQGGKTVADVAKAKGVDLNTIVNALVAEQQTNLQQAVTAGRLTQAQADAQLAQLKTDLPTRLSQPFPAQTHEFGGIGGVGSLTTIAKTLGISESELTTALQSGQSVADVAAAKNVDLNKIVDQLVAEQTTNLTQAVSARRLTQQQADQMLATLKANLPHLLSLKYGFGGPGFGFGRHQHGPQQPGNSSTPTVPNQAPSNQSSPAPVLPSDSANA